MKTTTPFETYETARKAVRDGEAKGLSDRTMNRKYRALFAAEDALKAAVGMWS